MKNYKYIFFTYGGAILITFLTILFIVLKLCNIIDWAWGWIFSPIWIGYLLALIAMFIYIKFM